MRLRYFQHVSVEGLGSIEVWARKRGFKVSVTRFYDDDSPPAVGAFDWLVIMGGPMNVYEYDRYPWLEGEKACIREAVEAGKTVVGVCLGAQLVAAALGEKVTPAHFREIGWFPITLTEAGRAHPWFQGLSGVLPAFHWHGDTFSLPEGATLIASSEGCRHQVFVYRDRVLALQCHLEATREGIDAMLRAFAREMIHGPYVQKAEDIRARYGLIAEMNRNLERVLDRLPQP
jgi:GMP synthase-like glutamine amidotransferase